MSKKVSELIKELDISIQELKGYADKLGIAISSARSTVELSLLLASLSFQRSL